MKKLCFILSFALPITGLANEPKATICYDSAKTYAETLAQDAKTTVTSGTLSMFEDIGDVQTEGWVFFKRQGGEIVIVASADGPEPGLCRLFFVHESK